MRDDSITLVFLSKGKVALIDSADADRVLRRHWSVVSDRTADGHTVLGYAAHYEWSGPRRQNTVYLHREIYGPIAAGNQVDHINRNTLDCRRKNLREATKAQNRQNHSGRRHNTSGYIGVCWHKGSRKWAANIRRDGRQVCVGMFGSAEEAARARDAAALELYGYFAHLNFPHDGHSWRIDRYCCVRV